MTRVQPRRGEPLLAVLAFLSFVVLGLAFNLLSVASLSIQAEFTLPVDSLGLYMVVQTAGYAVSSFFSGRVLTSVGTGRSFVAALALIALALFGVFVAPSWPLVLACVAVLGLAFGTLDAGMNNYIAAFYSARQMSWLHACFGVGATLGGLLMTRLLEADVTWRYGYAVTGIASILLAAAFLTTVRRWLPLLAHSATGEAGRHVPLIETLRRPILWISVALFVAYTGVEMGTGNWAAILFTQGRGVPGEVAGYWVSAYWASFTIGRIFFGFVSSRVPLRWLLRLCILGSVAGAALMLVAVAEIGALGLIVLGFMQAPLFPLFVLATVERVGPDHAPNAIGIEVAAAGVGIGIVPGIAGFMAGRFGVGILAPFFLFCTLLVLALNEAAGARASSDLETAGAAAAD